MTIAPSDGDKVDALTRANAHWFRHAHGMGPEASHMRAMQHVNSMLKASGLKNYIRDIDDPDSWIGRLYRHYLRR